MSIRDRAALCGRQAQGSVIRALTRQWSFFYFRTADFERNLQALKQFAAINGTGSQNKSAGRFDVFSKFIIGGF